MTDLTSKEALDALVARCDAIIGDLINRDRSELAEHSADLIGHLRKTLKALRQERDIAQLSAKQWEEEAHRRAINEADAVETIEALRRERDEAEARYQSAVDGRKKFRQMYRDMRDERNRLVDENSWRDLTESGGLTEAQAAPRTVTREQRMEAIKALAPLLTPYEYDFLPANKQEFYARRDELTGWDINDPYKHDLEDAVDLVLEKCGLTIQDSEPGRECDCTEDYTETLGLHYWCPHRQESVSRRCTLKDGDTDQ